VAGRLVRLACERHLRDLKDGPKRGLKFSVETAAYACNFFQYLRHSKGEWGGQRVVLEPWQCFVTGSVFGWLRKDGLRRFRTVYEEVARKNGKSTALAGIGVYTLVADHEPGAEIYAAATKKDQARIIFSEAQRMVRVSPELRALVSVFKLNMSVDMTASKFEPLSSDERTLDGLNPHVVLVDELHKHKSRALLDVMDTALGSRRQPLLWVITTAGDDNPESVYAQESDYAAKVLEGVVEDDSHFAYIATLDKEDRWDDETCWKKANPNLGVSVRLDDLQRQAAKARASPPALSSFLRLRLNIRTAAATRAIDMVQWGRNSCGPFDPADLAGRGFYGGLDLSSKVDLSAFVKLFPPVGEEERWRVVCRFWIPADKIAEKSDRDRVQYQRWVDKGLIEATAGDVIDHAEVISAIAEDCRIYTQLGAIAFDPWNAAHLSTSLQYEGIAMAEFRQGVQSYNAPMREMEAMLAGEKLDHGGNEVLAWMAHCLSITVPDRNENYMPSKKHSHARGRIDGMCALIMAIGRSMADDDLRGMDEFLNRPILA
jgi:phage terminase large subunit-like protein